MKSRLPSRLPAILLTLALFPVVWGATSISAQVPASKGVRKVLILGNSITRHGPKPDIGWTGSWGMAASAEEKDFVHLLEKGLTERTDSKPAVLAINIAEFERNYATYDVNAKLKEATGFGADLIVLAIGENVPALSTKESQADFQTSVQRLLSTLKGGRQPRIIVRSSFWANEPKDTALRQACEKSRGVFVDISALGKDESNYARSERPYKHEGVARHPGDKGMQAIAEAILRAVD